MFKVLQGDCREVMLTLEADSVDAIVTDPPYELGFIGKSWDSSGIAFDPEVWRQALRVLKPGGHLLAFSGSRTYHRMVCAIEDAGFEIRDQIMWLYGSGFPKSLDVSKAIDKLDAKEDQELRRLRFTAWVRGTGVSSREINEATGTNMGRHYATAASQPAIMTREHLEACRHLLGDVPEWVEREADIRSVESRNMAEREVVGQQEMRDTLEVRIAVTANTGQYDASARRVVNITAPATDAARTWSGWGTALKPAHEPIVVARKPFKGTVAQNVLAHGTGALNIDGCRVGTEGTRRDTGVAAIWGQAGRIIGGSDAGRWPANVIHDGSDEVVGLFPAQAGAAAPVHRRNSDKFRQSYGAFAGNIDEAGSTFHGDSGSAARFFYCAKASKRDREDGLDGFEAVRTGGMQETADGSMLTGSGNERTTTRANHHPTVKPTDLMRYLCRLVTPPGGLVLDPFTGSGSTGRGAVLEGFRFLGIEMDPGYMDLAIARIESAERSSPHGAT